MPKTKQDRIIKTLIFDDKKVDLVVKEAPISNFKVLDEEKGIFEAYVSVFGNIDSYGDIVDRGAFQKFIDENFPRYPKGVHAHDWSQPISKTLEIREDAHGLYVKGQLILEVQRAREDWALMKAGVLTDFSFGFYIIDEEIGEDGFNHLKEVAIYEYSPVLVGANKEAELISVKSQKVEQKSPEGEEEEKNTDAISNSIEYKTDDGSSLNVLDGYTDGTGITATDGSGGTTGGSYNPGDNPDPDKKAGRVLSEKNKKVVEEAIGSMRDATNALEALLEAVEDPDKSDESGQTAVDQRDKGSSLKLLLRDARQADKMVEKIIVRAKSQLKD